MNLSKKEGFTLLEIVIVIIIVGVLSAVALPRLLVAIELSRVGEAEHTIGVIRGSLERCGARIQDITGCNSYANLDIDDPTGEPGSHFTYAVSIYQSTNPYQYAIRAYRNTTDGGASYTATDHIFYHYNYNGDGNSYFGGSGVYSSKY